MSLIDLVLLSISLAGDAVAVSICKGMSLNRVRVRDAIKVGLYFGLFQGLMPILGYFLGLSFKDLITSIDHWIIFILLVCIGINMIRESSSQDIIDNSLSFKSMILLSLATSIDALAVGITFAFLSVNIYLSSIIIGIITFILSFLGVYIGSKFGSRLWVRAKVVGGVLLILIGLKILLEHLGII